MTEITSKYADYETLREQAVAMRREGLSLARYVIGSMSTTTRS
jgi:hypothetical protein